jgi:RNA polymerase sigma factor (sigma-70 family)
MPPRNETATERDYPSNQGRFAPWDRELPWQTHVNPWMEHMGQSGPGGEGTHLDYDATPNWQGHLETRRPINEFQALMECAPGDVPETHADQYLAIREVLADAIDELPEREREVFDGVFVRRETLQELGDRLGYSRMHISRIRDKATAFLRERLSDNPLILEYLGRHDMIEDDDDDH